MQGITANKAKDAIGSRIRLSLLLFFFSLHALPETSFAHPQVVLAHHQVFSLGTLYQIYEDKTQSLSIDQILSGAWDGRFTSGVPEDRNRGYSQSVFWIKFEVQNDSDQEKWYLIAEHPHIQYTAYIVNPSDPRAAQVYVPDDLRFMVSEFPLPLGSTSVVYLRLSSKSVLDLKFQLMTRKDLDEYIMVQSGFVAAFAGVAIALILYNGFVYFSLRDKNYLYYLMFAIFNTHIGLMSVRYPRDIFTLFDLDWWNIVHFYRPLAPLSLFLFTRVLFRTKSDYPRLDKLLLGYMAGLILILLANFFVDSALIFAVEDSYLSLGVAVLVGTGICTLRKNSVPARYYLLGLSVFILGIFIYLMTVQGFLVSNFYTMNAHLIGQVAELIVMSLALGANIKVLQEEVTSLAYQQKVAHIAKLSSLGIMAGGLAHEISNPLAIVMGQLKIAKNLAEDSKASKLLMRLESANQNCERIEKIIQAVRSLYQGNHLPGDKVFRLADAVNAILNQYDERIRREAVRLDVDIHPGLLIKAHPKHMEIVLKVLMDNALDAMRTVPSKRIEIRHVRRRDGLVLSLSDSGGGMTDEVRQRIFDPFFTTKILGQGMGLGLTLAHAIVDSYKWLIDVHCEPGRTKFLICIPADAVQMEWEHLVAERL